MTLTIRHLIRALEKLSDEMKDAPIYVFDLYEPTELHIEMTEGSDSRFVEVTSWGSDHTKIDVDKM
jgi:hypothetical protein